MERTIVIVGGLEGDPSRAEVLDLLNTRHPEVRWDWIKVTKAGSYSLCRRDANKYFGLLQTEQQEASRSDRLFQVVKLFRLHGRLQARLYGICNDPVLAPKDLKGTQGLIDWLESRAAGLFPPTEWTANVGETALVALICKLVKNKSWNKDTHGHSWTKEDDLLGQSPVRRPGLDLVQREAVRLLGRLDRILLLSKGGSRTPKEWCISTRYLPLVKRLLVDCDFAPLLEDDALREIVLDLAEDGDRRYQLMGEIVTERVRSICARLRSDG